MHNAKTYLSWHKLYPALCSHNCTKHQQHVLDVVYLGRKWKCGFTGNVRDKPFLHILLLLLSWLVPREYSLWQFWDELALSFARAVDLFLLILLWIGWSIGKSVRHTGRSRPAMINRISPRIAISWLFGGFIISWIYRIITFPINPQIYHIIRFVWLIVQFIVGQ